MIDLKEKYYNCILPSQFSKTNQPAELYLAQQSAGGDIEGGLESR